MALAVEMLGRRPYHCFMDCGKSTKSTESDLLKACEAAQAQKKKPNISKIAREYGVPYATLRDRVKKGAQPRTARIPANKALKEYQEEALIQLIVRI